MKELFYLSVLGGGYIWYRTLDEENQELVRKLADVSIISGIVGIPLGLWALSTWPEKHYIAAILLTAVGYITKQVMLAGDHHAPQLSGAQDVPQLGAWYGMDEGSE